MAASAIVQTHNLTKTYEGIHRVDQVHLQVEEIRIMIERLLRKMVKPFLPRELVLRLMAILKRAYSSAADKHLQYSDWVNSGSDSTYLTKKFWRF